MVENAYSLCVVTYSRKDGVFEKFLEALYTICSAPINPDEIIVVNNDDPKYETTLKAQLSSAKEGWMTRAKSESHSVVAWPAIIVKTSSEKNLAVARNLALDTASAPLLVFIDDDQQVECNWLSELALCQKRYNADVVAGPVFCEYPSSAPLWLKNTDIHNTQGKTTGDRLYSITAGNTLIRKSTISDFRFDPQFGRTGGEDTDFFKRLYESGHDIRWCEEAVSTEWITQERATASYAIGRFIDQGQTYRRINLANANAAKVGIFYARAALQSAVAGLIAAVCILSRRQSAGNWVKRCFNNVGKLTRRESSDYS